MNQIERIAFVETISQLREQQKRKELYLTFLRRGRKLPENIKLTDDEKAQVDRMLFENRVKAEKEQKNATP